MAGAEYKGTVGVGGMPSHVPENHRVTMVDNKQLCLSDQLERGLNSLSTKKEGAGDPGYSETTSHI